MHEDAEERRVAAVRRYGLIDAPEMDELRGIARIAAYIAGTPVAMINLIDDRQQHTAVAHGTDQPVRAIARQDSMCTQVVAGRRAINVPNLAADPRYGPNATGLENTGIRLYAAQPLVTPDGFAIGALCVLDYTERPILTALQLSILGDLAEQAVNMMELRLHASRLYEAALTDSLTGLPNRRVLLDRLRMAVARAERGQGQPALLFCDLDRFKEVNDTLGHEAGDEVLIETGHRLNRAVRAHDTIARWGGDEFVALCDPLELNEQAFLVAERLEESLCQPFATRAGQAEIGASVGVTLWRVGDTPEGMLAQADQAMFERKRAHQEGTTTKQPDVA